MVRGLFSLLIGGAEPLEVDVSGTVVGELRRDGTSFEDLIRTGGSEKTKKRSRSTKQQPFSLAGVPAVTVRLSDLTVRLREAGSPEIIEVEQLNGELAHRPGRYVKVKLAGNTTYGTKHGSIEVDGRLTKLFDKKGKLTPQRASGKIDLDLRDVPVPLSDPPTALRSLALAAKSDDLTDRLDVSIELEAVIGGNETGRLEAALTARRPIGRDGSIAVGMDRLAGLSGHIAGRSVPSGLLQPVLQKTPVVLVRDVGPTVDINADFSGGEMQEITVTAAAETMALEFSGTIDSAQRALQDGRLHCSVTITPELFSAATDMHIDRPATVAVDLESLSVPPVGDDPLGQLHRVAAKGRMTLSTPATISTGGDVPMSLALGRIDIRVETSGLGRGATVVGTAIADDAEASFELSVDALVDENGLVSIDRIVPLGTVTVRRLQPARLAALLPQYADLLGGVVEDPIDITAASEVRPEGLHLDLIADGRDLEVNASLDCPRRRLLDTDGKLDLEGVSSTGTATVRALRPAAVAALFPASADLINALLDDPIEVTATTRVQGGELRMELAAESSDLVLNASADALLRDLIDAEGRLVLDALSSEGTATLRGLEPETLARFAGQHAELIGATVDDPFDLTAVTSLRRGALDIALTAAGPDLDFEVKGTRREGTLSVAEGSGRLVATPALAAALQDSPAPIVLAEPAEVTFELEPFEIPSAPEGEAGALPESISGHLTLASAVLDNVPGLVEPLGVRDLEADATVRPGGPEPSISVTGDARLRRAAHDQDVAVVRCTAVDLRQGEVGEVSVEITDLSIRRLGAMLGNVDGDQIAEWIGESGGLTVALGEHGAGVQAEIGADFPHLAGDFVARDDGEAISVTAEAPRLSLSRSALQKRLTPAPAERPDAGSTRIAVVDDVPLTLAIRSLRLPRAALAGEPFDGDAVDVDVALRGGPLILDDAEVGRNRIDRLDIRLVSRNLNAGLDVSVTGDVTFRGAPEPGRIELDGRVTGLMADGVLAPDRARLTMTTRVNGLHTAVVDAVAGMQGLLLAAVGSPVDVEATAQSFTPGSGVLTAEIVTPNGKLEGQVTGRDNGLSVEPEHPVKAELEITPPFSERLLKKIHPLLADIRTTDQPLRATVSRGFVPMDGDVRRLQAQIEITIGGVELDSGSTTLALLTVVNLAKGSPGADARTIPGYIEPIKARIADGVVSYDEFTVKIDKYTLVYSGTVDLNARTVDLRTSIPLEGLAQDIRELRALPDDTIVPLVTSGSIDDPETTVDPSFLTKVAEGLLKKQIEKEAGKVLEGIFGKGKK
ncbi:MAG: hypothetical protein ACYS0G_16175 [Planctomycetota bacterium]